MSRLAPLALVLLVGTLSAQEASSLIPGSRIRVTSTAAGWDRTVVTFAGVRGDSLDVLVPQVRMVRGEVVKDSTVRSVPLSAVQGLDVNTGRHLNVGRGALIGAGVGGTLGLILGAAQPACDPNTICIEPSVGEVALGGMLWGAGIGALIGLLSHHDTWRAVQLTGIPAARRVSFGVAPVGPKRLGLAVSARF